MEREASYYKKLGNNARCELCPHFCFLQENETGKCGARKNISGKLISPVYNKPCSLAIDPIEKKPLYHFLPGEKTLSIATPGCNFSCKHCQNWQISQNPSMASLEITPKQIIEHALTKQAKAISYTYTEPTIFYEYMLDTSRLAKKAKLKNIMVTNGFINPEPLKELCLTIDASNIDIKGDNAFYERVCSGKLEPVLEAIKIMRKKGLWIELTYLIIPGLNDSHKEISKICNWVVKNLGKDTPLHFSAFYPNYKMLNLPATCPESVKTARNIAKAKGLNYVYTGNIKDDEGSNTYCPVCKSLLIERKFFKIIKNKLDKGKCFKCNTKIPGVWY